MGTRDERGRFRQGHANVRAGRPKGPFLPGTINDGLARWRTDAMREDVRVFLRCVAGVDKCESFSPRVQAPRPSAHERDPDFRKWWKDTRPRLKAAGLYPLPDGMTFEAAMEKLERREGHGSA